MRDDLALLDAEALAVLANRGLVKRATKMIDKGTGPELSEASGTVTGTFPDGIVTTWAPDVAIGDVDCTCAAHGICRHIVAVALAYEGTEGSDDEEGAPWDPGTFTDAQLEAQYGKNALTSARRLTHQGVEVRLEPGVRPVAHVPNGTVRFMAEGALGLTFCDLADPSRSATAVVLAVWAYRAADPDQRLVRLESERARVDVQELSTLAPLLTRIVEQGLAELPSTAAADLQRARDQAVAARYTWMADALDELADQTDAWRSRSLRHAPGRVAALVGELLARPVAAAADIPPSGGWFLGAGVAPKARLEHATLVGLGCTARTLGDQVAVEIYLLDRKSAVVLVLQRQVDPGVALASRKAGGLRFSLLAGGSLTTKGANRQANRALVLSGQGSGGRKHDLRPSTGAWHDLPAPIRIADRDTLVDALRTRVPKALRPRVLAEDLRVLALARCDAPRFDAGEQVVHAVAHLEDGTPVHVTYPHDPATPRAVAALSAVLEEAEHIAGHVTMRANGLAIEPTAVASAAHGVTVPAMATTGSLTADLAPLHVPTDPLGDHLRAVTDRLAGIVHHGTVTGASRVDRLAAQSRALGMRALSERLDALFTEPNLATWRDAWWFASVASERRGL